jgi:hypothetical protein
MMKEKGNAWPDYHHEARSVENVRLHQDLRIAIQGLFLGKEDHILSLREVVKIIHIIGNDQFPNINRVDIMSLLIELEAEGLVRSIKNPKLGSGTETQTKYRWVIKKDKV